MITARICSAKSRQGEINEDNLDEFLENDPSLQKTKDFTWTLCSLRRLRNSLARLIAAWVAFDRNHSVYFDLNSDGALAAKFRECFLSLRQSMAELGSLQMVLEQRIETMEKMSSVVCPYPDFVCLVSTSMSVEVPLILSSSWSMPHHWQRASRPLGKAITSGC